MIPELLSRTMLQKGVDRLLDETANELRLLKKHDREAKQRAEKEKGSVADLEKLKETIEEYKAREAEKLSGADEPVWMPRDPVTALVQSAYDEFFETWGLVKSSDQTRNLALAQIPISDLELNSDALEFLEGTRRLGGRWLTRFGERDARFITWGATALVGRWLRGKHLFPRSAASTYTIKNRDRVLLVGDWGSGIPRARQISTAMRSSLEQALRDNRCCHVIHLGDVYYTGQRREYDKRFLTCWPVFLSDPETTTSWCLNGNHDMYSGGDDYFDYLLADPRFHHQERSSYFCLENDYWQILGLDSAYDDGDLHGEQASWVHQQRTASSSKGGILLTHHQPFSTYESTPDRLLDRLRPTLNTGLVRAWFWGHEHRCALYEERERVTYPRLVGHGGVPVLAPSPNAVKPNGVRFQFGEAEDEYFYGFVNERFQRFGFAELTFENDSIEVRYVTELGAQATKETLKAKP
jgi:hypothetical protein